MPPGFRRVGGGWGRVWVLRPNWLTERYSNCDKQYDRMLPHGYHRVSVDELPTHASTLAAMLDAA
jgi:hypothetical protein